MFHDLDTVELTKATGGYPAGTRGTVVFAYENADAAQVEMPEDDEHREFISTLIDVTPATARVLAPA